MHLFQKIVPGIVKKSPKCSFSACETANYYTFAVVTVQLCQNYFLHELLLYRVIVLEKAWVANFHCFLVSMGRKNLDGRRKPSTCKISH